MIEKNRLLDTDLIIYQNDDWFKFSLDSVLLSKFVTINLRHKRIIDLATGNAPIPLFLSFRTNSMIYGVEYQKCVFDLGVKSIMDNKIENQIKLFNEDVRNIKKSHIFEGDSFDVVTCNPPYFKFIDNSSNFINDNYVKSIARHEIKLNLDDILIQAKYLLKTGGIFAMVHRTERFAEIIEKMKFHNIEPKRVQFIYPKKGRDSDLFLVEGIKNGNIGLKLLFPLIIYDDNDNYTEELQNILKFE